MWEHQQEMLEYIEEQDDVIIEGDMGTGKTRVIVEYLKTMPYRRVLIVCPLGVIRVWGTQFEKWGMPLPYVLLNQKGTQARLKALENFQNGVVVVSYSGYWRSGLYDALRAWVNDGMVVYDECHKLKAPGSRQSRAAYRLYNKTKKHIGLSGTLVTSDYKDIYAIMRGISPSVFGTRYDNFKFAYCVMAVSPAGWPFIVGYKNIDNLHEKLGIVARYWSRKHMILPEKLFVPIPVSLDNPSDYKTLENELIVETGEGLIVAANVLVKTLRLRQMAAGVFSYLKHKLEALEGILAGVGEEPIVIWTNFVKEVQLIEDYLLDHGFSCSVQGLGRHEVEGWERGNTQVLIFQMSAGTEGIDLTRSRINIYMSPSWNLGDWLQSQDRTCRPGNKADSVVYYYLVSENSIEQVVFKALQHKKSVLVTIKEYLGL